MRTPPISPERMRYILTELAWGAAGCLGIIVAMALTLFGSGI
ncbi:hypothetical protein [Devosia sp. RR2S18]|nr:hypothetical protein [Devosia sp. RR2S18]WIJ26581.1 hypothetical protein QOV41_07475 [Devosia sp. RR2S18]